MLIALRWHTGGCPPHEYADMFMARLALPIPPRHHDVLAAHCDAIMDMCYFGSSRA